MEIESGAVSDFLNDEHAVYVWLDVQTPLVPN